LNNLRQFRAGVLFHKPYNRFQRIPSVRGFTGNDRYSDGQRTMDILRVNLRDGRVKTPPRLVNKASADLPLIL